MKNFTILKRSEVLKQVVADLDRPKKSDSTGLPILDKCMYGGLFPAKAYGFQARKKVGKTILLSTISHNLNIRDIKHLFITGEMHAGELEHRVVAREMGFNSADFLTNMEEDRVNDIRMHQAMAHDSVLYSNAPGMSLDYIHKTVKEAVTEHQVQGVIVDYLQLIKGDSANRTEHLEYAAQALANLARIHNIWVMAAAQVNQDGNTRGGEGLKLAFDQVYTLHRNKTSDKGWLEMEESRYTQYANIGSKDAPGLKLEMNGPYFREC